MKAALAYSPRPGPLGSARPWIAAVYLAPAAFAAFAFSNPIVLAGAGLAAITAGYGSGAGSSLRQPLRWSVGLAVLVIAVNAVASQRGATILLRGGRLPVLGEIDVSLEAIVEGAVVALRIVVALLVFAVWSACVDPDRILRAIRPIASRSALTATMITRLVPLAAADGARLAEAGRLRGPASAPLGRAALARRLVAGSLDRSVEIASTLELRGYGLGHRARLPRHRREPGEGPLLSSGVITVAAIAAGAGAGIVGFDAYPTVAMDHGAATIALAAGLPLLSLLPLSGGILSRMAHPIRPRSAGSVDG